MQTHHIDQIKAVATAALRDADDGADFAAHIQEQFGIEIDILSGEEEAMLSARGLQAFFPKAKGVMADIGGGSMDMAILDKDNIADPVSMKIGALRLMENEANIDDFLQQSFTTLPAHYRKQDTIYAVGGSWRVFAESFQRENNIQQPHSHGFMMTAEEICAHAAFLRSKIGKKTGKMAVRYDIEKRRAKVLPYAAVALDALVKYLDAEKVIFSNAGLRDGVLRSVL